MNHSNSQQKSPLSPVLFVLVMLGSGLPAAYGTEFFVATTGNDANPGTTGSPFLTVQQGLDVAQPGDTVIVRAGIYNGGVITRRSGTVADPITLKSEVSRGATIETDFTSTVSALRIDNHANIHGEGFIIDGQYAPRDLIRVGDFANNTILRDMEIRRSGNDCIDVDQVDNMLVENSLIHHCLQTQGGLGLAREDAHAISGGKLTNFTLRNSEVHTFSGDGFQADPNRDPAGLDNVLIEGCTFWVAPFSLADSFGINGYENFGLGSTAAENVVDTKVNNSAPRARITIRNTVAFGLKQPGLITNISVFNIKNNVDAVLENITVFDSEIAFRLRGAGSFLSAHAEVRGAVIYDVDQAIRYEDDIEVAKIYNVTVGANVNTALKAASSNEVGVDVRNFLVLDSALPGFATGGTNLTVSSTAFVNVATNDYHLAAGSPAIDAGETIASVTKGRDAVPRPQGPAYDIGAYELCSGGVPADCVDTDGDGVSDSQDCFPNDPTKTGFVLSHNYVAGLNLVPLSVLGTLATSIDLENAIEAAIPAATVTRILGFDPTTQSFRTHVTPGLSFTLVAGEAYFVTISGGSGSLNVVGGPYTSLSIANGISFLAVEPASAATLLTSINLEDKLETQAGNTSAITRILGWDAATQSFRIHQTPGASFNLNVPSEGTIVFSNAAFTYNP